MQLLFTSSYLKNCYTIEYIQDMSLENNLKVIIMHTVQYSVLSTEFLYNTMS